MKNKMLNLLLLLVIVALSIKLISLNDDQETNSEVAKKAKTSEVKENMPNTHEKVSVGKANYLFPKPAVVIGSYGKDNMPNIMTASWTGICCSNPASIAVSLRPATLSYHNITETQAFTVNVPSEELAKYVDFVGKYSGRDMNKFERLGLTPVHGDSVNAPYISEFPIVIECRVTAMHDLGSHRQFIGEIINTKVDSWLLDKDGYFAIEKLKPIVYADGNYYGMGALLGISGAIVKTVE